MNRKPKKTLKTLFIFNGLLLLATFILLQFSVVKHEKSETVQAEPVLKGRFADVFTPYDPPRDIADISFQTAFDKQMRLDDLKGQWVVLNFWATWCPPCLVEMPSLQRLQDKMGGQGVKVVAISLDRNMTAKKLRDFMNRKRFGPVAAYYDPSNTIMKKLNFRGLPTTLVLSPNGKAIGVVEGDLDWGGDDALAFITSLLTQGQR